MAVILMLAANLRKYVPGCDGENGWEVIVEPASTVRDLTEKARNS